MRRREFIGLIGGAAVLPLAARAEPPTMPVVGFLDTASPGQMGPFLTMFRQGLLEGGFVEGQNVAVEYRWGENHNDRLPALAADLVERHVAAQPRQVPAHRRRIFRLGILNLRGRAVANQHKGRKFR